MRALAVTLLLALGTASLVLAVVLFVIGVVLLVRGETRRRYVPATRSRAVELGDRHHGQTQ